MKRVSIVAIGLVVLVLGGCWVADLFRSDEDRIVRLIQGMMESFNDSNARTFVGSVSEEYEDLVYDFSKQDLRLVLGRIFTDPNQRDPKTRKFRFRGTVPRDEMKVFVDDPEPGKARVEFQAYLYETSRGDDAEPVWNSHFVVGLARESGDWMVVSSKFDRSSGRLPF